ncbi:hypothetical protein TWF730_005057 [Orbilia blumenaviensis]|uniref:Nucleoporin Nup159/Nup146 N-terminal domain-containing protein n=1 Tax=Orbilia blumenaviensis TaxID=1796055 RepID=A0AAV9VKG5_9PEZI
MSFGQPSSFGVLNSSQTAPNTAFSRSNSIAQGATNTAFSRSSSIAAPHGPAEVVMGDEVPESESDAIGYVGLAGELKVKVFDGQYPENDLPIPSSQLLSVSQKRQLFAAGGPQGVVVARTSTLRASFKNISSANGKIIPFQPECVIPMSLRLSHIAFTADGTYLLLAAQLGGIAVYLVDEILSKGNDVQPQSQIIIGPLLEMKPIPTVAEAEKVCVLVGSGWGQGGNVGILDLKTSQIQENLKSGVTTVCWSPKGKQIICGGSGGGFAWIKPDGKQDDAVEGVPNYPNYFVSSIFWIEAATIFVVLTPKPQLGQPHDNESIHFVLMRELHTRKHTFYRINDMTPPFGMTSRPTYHSFIHLKAWGPNLKDCLILSNTCSTDIGTVLRLTNTPFTPTSIMSDGRRATLPLTADGGDTTPIGLSLDLTATDVERVTNPFPNVEQSATSLPCMWVLTNEGVISAYWVVHSDAIKVGNSAGAYPELVAYESQQPPQTPQRTTGPAFGQAGFGQSQTSTFGTPKPAFGQPSTPTSTFGQPSKPLAFGQPSAPVSTFGQASQPANSFGQASTGTSAFGQQSQPNPAFGQPSQPTSTFGQSSAPQPVFGQSSAPQSAFGQSAGAFGQTAPKPAFGQPSFGSTSALGRPGMSSGAFGSSTGSAFGGGSAFGAQQGASAFGQKPAAPAFGATTALGSAAPAFGSPAPLGSTAPAFGSATALGQARPAFGQPAFGSSGAGTGFGQTSQLGSKLSAFGSTTAASTGGFAKFSGGGGFGSSNTTTTASPAFLQQSGSNNPFASKEPDTFGTLKNGATVSAFGSGGQGNFAISSAFGSTATPDNGKPSGSGPGTGAFGAFGNSLGSALSQPAASINIKDDEMADSDGEVEQPRAGVRGGNMFSLSAVNNTATAATETPKPLAPAFGQPSQLSAGPSKPSAFGSGIFGSTLNKEPKGAFGSQNKTPALAPAFGTSESKPSVPVSAFGPKSPETPSDKVGTGLFGSALQRTTSGAQPASAFGTTGSSSSKLAPAFGTTTASVTSAFSKSVAPTSAFAAGPSSPSKPIVSAFGQKSTPVVSSPEKTPVASEVGAAASKVLPSDDSDEDTDHSLQEVEAAPLPPDFAPAVKKSQPTLSEDAPLPPDFAPVKAGPLKTPLPESAPRTPALAPTLPKPVEQAEKPTEKPAAKSDTTKDKTPPKSNLFGLPPPAQSPASTLKPTKAANPMSNRRGSKLTTTNVLKPTLSGRTPSQKAGATTKGTKLASKDHDEKDDLGSPKLESFFPGAGAKVVGPQKNGESVLTLGKSAKAIDTGFSFGDSKIDEISDSSEEEDEDDASDADNDENNGLDPGEDSDQPTGSEDGIWVEDGDTEDEDSPTQQPIPPKNIKNPPRRDLGSLFSHASPPPTERTVKRVPVTTTKAAYVPKTANKAPIKLQEPSKVTPNSLAAVLSPNSTKTKKEDVSDRHELKNNLDNFDTDKEKRERELLEARDRALREQEHLLAMKRLEIARNRELNNKEEEEKRREADYREKLALPPDPSPTLNPLIPYREQASVTNFEGQDGALENAVITLERRIDNFGENIKNLKAFVIYHRESDHFTLDDPRPVEELRVTAAPDISLMAKDLMEKFHELEKTLDLAAFRAGITPLIRDIDYLVARASDIPNMLLIHNHPELRAYLRKRPLSSQQRMRQAYLRRKLPIMRRRFKRTEGMYRVLQARIACLNKNNGTNIGDLAPPTIEHLRESAVYLADSMRERAQRVDELEGALRKMRLSGGSPAMSRGTTPSFRASSIGFSTSGRDFDRGSTPGWLRSTRKSKGPLFSLPTKAAPGPDSLDYYESTIDNPISRYQYGKQPKLKPKTISGPGTFGLTEEELGEDEYFNGKDPSSSNGFPIATSYDRIMAGMRKEILITPKKGDTSREVPETPASRRVNKFVGVQVAMMTGGRARKTWINETDYLEDRKLKKEIGGRLSKLIKQVGVKTTKIELA